MSPWDCALAVFLLTAPADAPVAAGLDAFAPALQPAIVHAALLLEILDPRELGVDDHPVGVSPRPGIDLKELQTRYRDLVRAPLLEECQLFPPKHLIDEWLATNRRYKAALEARRAVDQIHAEELRRAMAETEELYRIWNLARDAQYECYYITVRRRSLLELRDLLGLEAYCRGQLPPHLPVWHFPAWR
jgi:hypothetical protein